MNYSGKGSWRKSVQRHIRGSSVGLGALFWLGAVSPVRGLPARVQSKQPAPVVGTQTSAPSAPRTVVSASRQALTGTIGGSVTDENGTPVTEARVKLTCQGQSTPRQARTGIDGQFSFANIPPGSYRLTIAASGFKTQTSSIVLQPGESYTVPRIVLALAPLVTTIEVTPSRGELAKYQMQQEEKQLVLGFVPNYYVTYFRHTAPLSPKEKFQLAWKSTFNPFIVGLTAAIAGGEQGLDMYSGYGQGAEGYGKRYGAAYANIAISTFVGDDLLPTVLKQDPRFYYKGSGSFRSRFLYAVTHAVICKGDNGKWEPDYSGILGHFVAGGLSNLYYPAQNRNGVGLTLENAGISFGVHAAVNLLQEFVLPKLTPSLAHRLSGRH